ncbi:MAG: hypothetical protein HY026_03705 [Deltaproteobacteria bacterium]|nr:hypothetical protein [Deltaproteobacteria bacterium]
MNNRRRLAGRLLRAAGVVNIISGLIHVFLPTIGKWDTLFQCVPPDYISFFAISSKEYLYSSNYELVFICAGAGGFSLRYASKLEDGNRIIAWLSIWIGVVILYRAVVQFYFFGTSFYSIVAFFVILSLTTAYLFPLFILKEFREE